jgi:uncharacterized protein involved in response to NO
MATLITLREAPCPGQPAAFALWQLGFRPFHSLASSFAALSIALWALQFSGVVQQAYLQGPLWHAHEMLFGFALAVVVGFLLTAGRNWSGQATLSGFWLAALAGLWLAGRILVLTPWGWAAALANTAFPLSAAVALGIPFYKGRNRRNYFFVGVLLLMGLAELSVHLSALAVLEMPPWAGLGLGLGLDGMLFVMAVMAGRVTPMFTNNGVPGAHATRHAMLEKAALDLVLALLVADLLQLQGRALALLALTAALAHLARWWLWQPWKTLRVPLVWVLHLAYLWIPVHLMLRALAALAWVPSSAATHALTAGAMGCMVIGMMTRTALGHTGRPLRAGRCELGCYVLIGCAGLVRVWLPLLAPALTFMAVLGASVLWSCGFAWYALAYGPMLCSARADGHPG